jgi:O-antigen/teichoic acid export membrane protein
VYATAEKVVKSMCGMIWQLSSVLFPRVNLLKGQNKSLRSIRLASIASFMVLAICSAASLYFFIDHIALYMNFNVEAFGSLLQILLFSIPAIVISSIVGLQYLVVERMEKAFGIIVFIGGLLNISMAYFLISALGPDGMAISWVTTEWTVLLMIVGVIYIYRQKLMK